MTSLPVPDCTLLIYVEMNMEAIGAHACKKSAALALKGDYTPSRLNAFMYQRLLHRKATV